MRPEVRGTNEKVVMPAFAEQWSLMVMMHPSPALT